MKVVIVGNGVAGISAASMLAGMPELSIDVFSEEEYHCYNRPLLLEFLAGRIAFDRIFIHPEEWYAEKGIRVRLRESVLALDPSRKEISIKGEKLSFDKLLLSTGCRANLPTIKGIEKTGVFTLRTARDALSIREHSRSARRAVIIGGGLLGLETAGALHSLGLDVTVVEFYSQLLPKQLDKETAHLLTKMLELMGIRIIVGTEAEAIVGDRKVERLLLKDGTGLEADLLVITTGTRPRTELAEAASIKVNRGIVVDDHMQTSETDVYACGDVAEYEKKIEGIIPIALDQSRVAASNILGRPITYQMVPHPFTLKVEGIKLASIGDVHSTGGDYEERKSIDSEKGIMTKLFFRREVLVGAILLGELMDLRALQKLIVQKQDASKLKDSFLLDLGKYV